MRPEQRDCTFQRSQLHGRDLGADVHVLCGSRPSGYCSSFSAPLSGIGWGCLSFACDSVEDLSARPAALLPCPFRLWLCSSRPACPRPLQLAPRLTTPPAAHAPPTDDLCSPLPPPRPAQVLCSQHPLKLSPLLLTSPAARTPPAHFPFSWSPLPA